MATYKTITIPKRGGGTRRQRVQVLKSGKYRFVKNTTRSKTTSKKRTKKRRNPRMARRKRRNTRRRFTLPLAVVLPIGASFFTNMGEGSINPQGVVGDLLKGQWGYAGRDALLLWTGLDTAGGGWKPMKARALIGTIVGCLVHKFASFVGVNRILGRAGVPIIRV